MWRQLASRRPEGRLARAFRTADAKRGAYAPLAVTVDRTPHAVAADGEAEGRDYADVPPTRGVFKGSAQETLAVHVRLQAL